MLRLCLRVPGELSERCGVEWDGGGVKGRMGALCRCVETSSGPFKRSHAPLIARYMRQARVRPLLSMCREAAKRPRIASPPLFRLKVHERIRAIDSLSGVARPQSRIDCHEYLAPRLETETEGGRGGKERQSRSPGGNESQRVQVSTNNAGNEKQCKGAAPVEDTVCEENRKESGRASEPR